MRWRGEKNGLLVFSRLLIGYNMNFNKIDEKIKEKR
jgi:hypothetical protein